MTAELMLHLVNAGLELDAETKGRIFGFVLYQVAETVATAGAAKAVEAGAAAGIISRLIAKFPQLGDAKFAKPLAELARLLEGGEEAAEASKDAAAAAGAGRKAAAGDRPRSARSKARKRQSLATESPRLDPRDPRRGIWSKPDRERGFEIERRLGGRTGLHEDFPGIDRFENGVATSVKSMDLLPPSYQKPQQITSTGQSYIDAVSAFATKGDVRYAGVTVRRADVSTRALELVVPPGSTPAQRRALQGLIKYGRQQNPPVIVKILEMAG